MQVALFGTLREEAGLSLLEMPVQGDGTVRGVLERLFEAHPTLRVRILGEGGDLADRFSIFVHGRNIRLLQGLDTPIQETDRIAIFPPLAGG